MGYKHQSLIIFFEYSHSLPLMMTRGGGHDPIDPLLIVKSSCVSHPSKQVRGVDYSETVGNTVQLTRKSALGNSSKG